MLKNIQTEPESERISGGGVVTGGGLHGKSGGERRGYSSGWNGQR